ncbi:MAG: hypothetical protein ACK4P4_21190, partial [Allorhizobium sp.]
EPRTNVNDRLEDRHPRGRGPSFLEQRQYAETSLMFSKHAGFKAKAEISNGGLLSIAALVSSVLLTTTVLVHVAVRDGKGSRRSLL